MVISSNSGTSSTVPVSAAQPNNNTQSATQTGIGTLPAQSQLNESDFLTLLSAELQYQNPTSPVNNTQFIAELAQFSSLSANNQQEQTLTQILGQLSGTGSNPLLSAAQLIGKTVTTSTSGSGVVNGVTLNAKGGVEVELKSGKTVALSDISSVANG